MSGGGVRWGRQGIVERHTRPVCRGAAVRPRTDPPAVLVQVIGPLTVVLAGQVRPPAEVGSRKGRTLLALLAVERGCVVGVDRVVDVVWEDRPPRRPEASAATLVSRLRGVLGQLAVVGGRSGYRLGERVQVDLYDVVRLVTRAEAALAVGDPSHALEPARSALRSLQRGLVLSDQGCASWAEPARAFHGELCRRARHAVAGAACAVGDVRLAQSTAMSALVVDPLDETACRLLMRAHARAGEPARALRAYEKFRQSLAADLGVDPASVTRELHLAILRS
jgi:DNA-binding SARP family transcriptional activator